MSNKISTTIKKEATKKTFRLLAKASDENIIRLTTVLEQFAPKDLKGIVTSVKGFYKEKTPALTLTKKGLHDINPKCQEKILDNLIVTGLLGNQKTRDKIEAEGGAPLFTLLISPSMRCNLRCIGCYAGDYEKKDDLSFETWDRIITEGEEMGVSLFTILGGEPFIRKDIFDIFKNHPDSYFQVFTNGTLINEEIAEKLLAVGNVTIYISVEGLEEATDFRRGKGTFKKAMEAFDILREKGIPLGYSTCVTRKNIKPVTSDEFVDLMIEKGALVGWYFLYMPVCGDTNLDMMPTPEQRNYLRIRRDEIRTNKPLFMIDFWNDAPYVGGCIAGKHYAHVNNYGDVEPCIFTHFAESNINKVSLDEAMKCDFFKEIRKRQPYDQNLLLPCMLIDHPEVSREVCQNCQVYPTHPNALTLMEDLDKDLDKYSKEAKKLFDKVWEEETSNKTSKN